MKKRSIPLRQGRRPAGAPEFADAWCERHGWWGMRAGPCKRCVEERDGSPLAFPPVRVVDDPYE